LSADAAPAAPAEHERTRTSTNEQGAQREQVWKLEFLFKTMPLLQQYDTPDCSGSGGNMRALSGGSTSELLQKHSISSYLDHHQQQQQQHQLQLQHHQQQQLQHNLLDRCNDDGLISFINDPITLNGSSSNGVVGIGQSPSTLVGGGGSGSGGAPGVAASGAATTGVGGAGSGGALPPGPGVGSGQGGGVVGPTTATGNPSASFGGNGSGSDVNNLLLASAAAAAAAAAAAGDGVQLSANAAVYAPLTPSSTQSSASPGTKSSFDYFQVRRPGVVFLGGNSPSG